MGLREDALEYHRTGRKGKIALEITKPCKTQRDLSLAYSPGVAYPCLEIAKNPDEAFNYTSRGNLVAVISNGTAVLGLGNIGALAGKPVMEGKGVLFKRFADIDVFDIEIATEDPEKFIETVKLLEPTFGGINLEDIKAPECFIIEDRLKEIMEIPVFHDDQHGTAIISGAGLLNALELVKKDIDKVRIVINGAGASAIACANIYLELGAKLENIIMCDSKGVIYKGRQEGMNKWKEKFAQNTSLRTLAEAMVDADVFIGLSVANVVSKEMVKSMARDPIVFAMANPDPEISYNDAKDARSDVIIATGRSDYPNQVNNVLGFPFIFRGALDVQAKAINMEMKLSAAKALSELAKQDVPDNVARAYGLDSIRFGKDYIIPKPIDSRVLLWEAPAVAKSAIKSGVARITDFDEDEYRVILTKRLGVAEITKRVIINKAKEFYKKIVFPEGDDDRIIRASKLIVEENFAQPILLGNPDIIKKKAQNLGIELNNILIEYPETSDKYEKYVNEYFKLRQRKGLTLFDARYQMLNPNYFGSMMVKMGDADCLLSGIRQHYPDTIRPALKIIGTEKENQKIAGLYIMLIEEKTYFFADTTVNIDPTADDLAHIAVMAANVARSMDVKPRVAMLSFSNFGSVNHPVVNKVREAVQIARKLDPTLIIDGEMQADTAVVKEILEGTFPFASFHEPANVLIFPDLNSGNIAYKLLNRLGKAETIGPILMGIGKSVHVLQQNSKVEEVVAMAAWAVKHSADLEKITLKNKMNFKT